MPKIESIEQAIQVVDKLKESFQGFAADCAMASDGLGKVVKELKTEQNETEQLKAQLDGVRQLLSGTKEKDNDDGRTD